MTQTVTMQAGQRLELWEQGDYFRLMESSLPVTVTYYRNGQEVAEATAVRSGYAERFRGEGFDRVAITNGATVQDVKVVVRLGQEVAYDVPPTGDVNVVNTGGAFTIAEPAVTSVASQVLAAKANRRYLLVQNNDGAANVRVTVDGSAPTNAHGIKLAPGGSVEFAGYVPTGAVRVIADQPTAIVTVVEG